MYSTWGKREGQLFNTIELYPTQAESWGVCLNVRVYTGEKMHLIEEVQSWQTWRESDIIFRDFESLFYGLFCNFLDPVLEW